jgi:hypothetical protein
MGDTTMKKTAKIVKGNKKGTEPRPCPVVVY